MKEYFTFENYNQTDCLFASELTTRVINIFQVVAFVFLEHFYKFIFIGIYELFNFFESNN